MATLLHHISYIENLVNRGTPSDDTRLTKRLIGFALKQSRNRLIQQKLTKNDFISDNNYQRICIPLVPSSYHNCGCLPEESDCLLLRSSFTLPHYLVGKSQAALQVSFLSGKKLSLGSITSKDLSEYSLASKDKIGYFIDEQYLYVVGSNKLKYVIVKGLWEDPEMVQELNNSTCTENNVCTELINIEFPIDSELVQPMYELTLNSLKIFFTQPEDDRNDGKNVENMQATDPNETR